MPTPLRQPVHPFTVSRRGRCPGAREKPTLPPLPRLVFGDLASESADRSMLPQPSFRIQPPALYDLKAGSRGPIMGIGNDSIPAILNSAMLEFAVP